jgi:hypothetical protein
MSHGFKLKRTAKIARLTLARETLTDLTEEQAEAVKGGGRVSEFCSNCPSCYEELPQLRMR